MKFCSLCRRAAPGEATICSFDGCPLIERAEVSPRPGEVVAGYRLIDVVAVGAAGTVYRAEASASGDRVALKLLSPELSQITSALHRIRRETKNTIKLNNPHIARVIDCGDEQGRFYVVREWLEGHPLSVAIREEGPLEPDRALAIAYQICAGLDLIHRVRLVHRDIKPNHVFLAEEGGTATVKLIDIGVASKIYAVQSAHDIFGTPGYLSPEQAESKLVTSRSDFYSLGCVIYEMLIGRPPFTGSPQDLVGKHLSEPPPALEEALPDIPAALSRLVGKMLSKQTANRPVSAALIRKEIEGISPSCSEPVGPVRTGGGGVAPPSAVGIGLTPSPDEARPASPATSAPAPGSDWRAFAQPSPAPAGSRTQNAKGTILGLPVVSPEKVAEVRGKARDRQRGAAPPPDPAPAEPIRPEPAPEAPAPLIPPGADPAPAEPIRPEPAPEAPAPLIPPGADPATTLPATFGVPSPSQPPLDDQKGSPAGDEEEAAEAPAPSAEPQTSLPSEDAASPAAAPEPAPPADPEPQPPREAVQPDKTLPADYSKPPGVRPEPAQPESPNVPSGSTEVDDAGKTLPATYGAPPRQRPDAPEETGPAAGAQAGAPSGEAGAAVETETALAKQRSVLKIALIVIGALVLAALVTSLILYPDFGCSGTSTTVSVRSPLSGGEGS